MTHRAAVRLKIQHRTMSLSTTMC